MFYKIFSKVSGGCKNHQVFPKSSNTNGVVNLYLRYGEIMFGRRISLFKLFGFEIWIDPSWFILGVLITWSLAVGFFPFQFEGLSTTTYWIMGVVGAIGIFGSIVFHELWHSLVARRYGLPMKGITLFIFGGVAEMTDEPPSAEAEFMMAVAGPVSSVILSGGFFVIYLLIRDGIFPVSIVGIIFYLGFINGILAAFNLIPGFPLDGGRLLRSGLWAWKNDLRWATNIASKIGSGFGMFLIFLGIISAIGGNFIGGIWYFLIGLFLRNAATMSYQQVLMQQFLEGEPVKHFMNPHPISVPSTVSVEEFVDEYVYRYHYKMFPVMKGNDLSGCLHINQVKEVPRDEWKNKKVGDISKSCSNENTIGPNEEALKALKIMSQSGESRLMVVSGKHLLGLISLKDLLRFLTLKLDLEGGNK
jgi:Zn-dependent protease